MREIKISQETATRWYNGTDAELKALAVQTYPELAIKVLPKTWKELVEINGWYVGTEAFVEEACLCETDNSAKDIFATKEQAQASIAMAQLSQLMKVYNDGWVADWNDLEYKYMIYFSKNKVIISSNAIVCSFLHFKDRETAELFLENFKDLIEIAKPLL